MPKVIFDTDPGVDDAMALLFLHRHPEIDLVGITTVFGNAAVETTTRNALFLKSAFKIDAPVVRGAGVTFDRDRPARPWPTIVHGENGLGDIDIPNDADLPIGEEDEAAQFIIDTIRQNPGEISIVAVGRMTNLANALAKAPDIAGLVRDVVIMGGSFYVPGNVTPAAEANIAGDPEAADRVMTAPWKVAVIGLDVTTKTVMTRATLKELADKGGPEVSLLNELSQSYIDFYDHLIADAMLVHDTCACVYLVRPDLFDTVTGQIRVSCDGLTDGQTVLKPSHRRFPPGAWDHFPAQTVAVDVAADRVMALVHDTLVRR
ncbi:nucleoside hydrolase [Pseudaminobacter soli (ex Li et al. 2025)]|uniref:Nucleoside hydrolase n=1 Tax=Pseudaminobacter soli (ex Li et al. 2025) TaxID=1295366 RepID=A0A2P7SGB4_9HYPH|nr:nucleoside hydrolase [Mesorhizobium soli]PSJ61528.1 nucleoside hydrolase [Mesorhizobium soli]